MCFPTGFLWVSYYAPHELNMGHPMHLLICYTTHFPCLHSCISTSVRPSILHTFGVRSLEFMPSTLSNPVCSSMDFFPCSQSVTSGFPMHIVSRVLRDSARFPWGFHYVSPFLHVSPFLLSFAGFLLAFPSTQYVRCNELANTWGTHR